MNNLAGVLENQGKCMEAEQMHQQALGLMEKALGQEHPDTLVCMNCIAIMLGRRGKDKEAEEIHQQTLELREKVLG
jgi:Flp pilus assembly protein TadD